MHHSSAIDSDATTSTLSLSLFLSLSRTSLFLFLSLSLSLSRALLEALLLAMGGDELAALSDANAETAAQLKARLSVEKNR